MDELVYDRRRLARRNRSAGHDQARAAVNVLLASAGAERLIGISDALDGRRRAAPPERLSRSRSGVIDGAA